ncbi:MAG: hypothetical protein HQK53_13340 [Oligoflexia bacterium]|nr:hypothetical protein [Oligoflexia bacterium]
MSRLIFFSIYFYCCLLPYFSIFGTEIKERKKETKEVIVLFDQSGSINIYDSKLASKAWQLSLLKDNSNPYRIILAGFDDKIHIYIDIFNDKLLPERTKLLPQKLQNSNAKGYTTDFERPFKYLLENKNIANIDFVLIISDGIPDIFDKKLGFLSWRIREDRRYQDLLSQYYFLKAQGKSAHEIYKKMGDHFFKRNIDFIEKRLPPLKDTLGKKIIIWDISAQSAYLKRWAMLAGAQYLSIKITNYTSALPQLMKAVGIIEHKENNDIGDNDKKEKNDFKYKQLLNEVVVSVVSKKIENKNKNEVLPERVTIVKKITHIDKDNDKESFPLPPKKVSSVKWVLWSLFFLGVVLLIFFVGIKKRVLFNGNINWKKKLILKLFLLLKYVAKLLLRKRFRSILDEAYKIRNRLINIGAIPSASKKFELRIKVPKGFLEIYWLNHEGNEEVAHALDISMHGVKFENKNFDAYSILRIQCPNMDLDWKVTRSKIVIKNDTEVVMLLEKFENNTKSWMNWVELLTRVNRG